VPDRVRADLEHARESERLTDARRKRTRLSQSMFEGAFILTVTELICFGPGLNMVIAIPVGAAAGATWETTRAERSAASLIAVLGFFVIRFFWGGLSLGSYLTYVFGVILVATFTGCREAREGVGEDRRLSLKRRALVTASCGAAPCCEDLAVL
jgi:hypothetical protein